MNRVLKSIMAGALCLGLLCSVGVNAEAAESVNKVVESSGSTEMTMAEITIPEEVVMANVARVASNGEVDGNGVRLREKASAPATVLELMYNGESVYVNRSKSVIKGNTLWYYLKRIKTGTWGYADSDFITYY